jgi:hypothetical protein
MVRGMHLLGVRIGTEEPGHVGPIFLLGPVGEGKILDVRLALSGESVLEILFGHLSHGGPPL